MEILQLLLQPFFEILGVVVFLGVGYIVGFFPVLIGSLGTVEPGPIDFATDGGKFYRSKGMKCWHVTYLDDGKRYLPAETVALAGWILLIILSIVIWAIIQIAV